MLRTTFRFRCAVPLAVVIALLAACAPAGEPAAAADVADEVISLPLRELGIVIDREQKGVYMPYAELMKLWRLASDKSGEPEPAAPATFVVRSARLGGTLEGETISLTATFDVELLTDEWTFVELGLNGVAVTRALDGDGPLAFHMAGPAPRPESSQVAPQPRMFAELQGKGAHTLTVEGLVSLAEDGTRFAFGIPRAAVSLVELSVPAGRKLEIEGALLTSTEALDTSTAKHALLLGPMPFVRGTLSAADEAPKAPGVFYARTDTVVGFTHSVVQTTTRIMATVRHEPIETIGVLVPADVNVTSVTGEGVSDWDVRPVENGQRVTIQLARRVRDRVTVELRTETFYDRTVTSLDVPLPVVENTSDLRAFVGVNQPPSAKVYIESTTGMLRTSKADLAQGTGPVATYRFWKHPAGMTLGLEWPKDRFRVFDTTLLDVQRDALGLDTVLTVTPLEGTVFDLAIAVPPDYEVLDVGAASGDVRPGNRAQPAGGFKVEWDLDAQHVLHVRLPHKIAPPQALVLVINTRKLPRWELGEEERDARATEPLGGFIVEGAERQTGTIGIAADPSYLVEDEEVEGLQPAPMEELNAAGMAGAGLRFGYSYRRPPFSANLVISKKRPLIEVATGTTVAVHGEVIDVLALSEFSIAYSTVGEIVLRLPETVKPDNVEITGDDIRDRHRLTDEEKATLGEAAEGHIWRVTLDVRKTGVYLLSVAYQVTVGKEDATNWIPLPDYSAMADVEADRGFVAIIANREIELETKAEDERLRAMDKTDVPTRLFPSTPLTRVLFAYQYPKPPESAKALGLIVKRHKPADILNALVERAEIIVTVSHDKGSFTDAHYWVLNNNVPALRMQLPEKSVLWSVLVGGKEIKPRVQKDTYVIPLSSSVSPDESQEVVVRYRSATPPLKPGGGTYKVWLPTFDNMQVGQVKVVIYQPDEFRFIRFGGNMNLKAEVKKRPLLVRWFTSTDEALEGPGFLVALQSARESVSVRLAYEGGEAYDMETREAELEEVEEAYTRRPRRRAEAKPAETAGEEADEDLGLDEIEGEMHNGRPTDATGPAVDKKDITVWVEMDDRGGVDSGLAGMDLHARGLARGILTLNIGMPVEGVEVPFDRLSGGGEVEVRYASSNGMGRTQTIAIVLTVLVGYWLRKRLRWSRAGLVLFLLAVCTLGPGLSNYWMTPYWDMVAKGALLLIPVFLIDYLVMRIGRRRAATAATAAAVLLGLLAIAPAARAEEPVRPAAVIEEEGTRIYVPFTEVDRALLGDDVGVFVPFAEFLRLWERAYPELVRKAAPRDYALTNAVYRGRLRESATGEKRAAFTVKLDVAIMSDRWTAVPLAFGGAAIEKATLDGKEAPLTMIGGTPSLVFEKAGRHALELEFKAPVTGVAEQGSLRLTMPRVEVAVLEIEVPAGELEFKTDANARRGTTAEQAGSTTYRLPVGGLQTVGVSWRAKGLARTVGRPIFHHEGTTRLYVDEGLVLGELASKVTLTRGQLDGLLYDVPAGVSVLDVAAPGMADWNLEKAEAARTFEAAGGTLSVEFAQPVTTTATVAISFALRPETVTVDKLAFPDVRVHDAQTDRGLLEFYVRHGLGVTLLDKTGLEPKLRPKAPRTCAFNGMQYEPHVAQAYPRRPFALALAVEPVTDTWTASVQTLYTVLEQRTLMESRIQVVPTTGSFFELLVEAPEEYEVLEVSGDTVAAWRVADSERNLIAVELTDEQTRSFGLRLLAERLHDEMPATLTVRPPRLMNVAQDGHVAVAFDRAWDIEEPQHSEAMHAVSANKTPSWMRQSGAAQVRYGAWYFRHAQDPQVSFGLRQVPTRLSATLAHHLSVFSDEVALRVLVAYSIDGKPVRELKFTAPAELHDDLRVVGQGLRGPAKCIGQDAGRDIWSVTFHSPAENVAAFEVRWRGEVPADRTLAIPRIAAVDASVQTVYATVENLSANEVTATATTNLTKVPPEQVPVVPPGARLSNIVLAYRSAKPEWGLDVSVVAYAAEKLIEAQILSATLETVVDVEGQARTRMTLLVRNRTEQFLGVVFPEEIELWALLVGGEPAQPSSAKDGKAYLFPLIKTGLAELPFEVVAIYTHRIGGAKRPSDKRLAWSGGFELEAPRIEGLPTNKTVWWLWLPEGYRYLKFGGNMEQIEETLSKVEEVEQLTAEYERQVTLAERSGGKLQAQAIENVKVLEKKLDEYNKKVMEDIRTNDELLWQSETDIQGARNVSREMLQRQQALSKEKLEESQRRFQAGQHRAGKIAVRGGDVQVQREEGAQPQVEFDDNVTGNWYLNAWGVNGLSVDQWQSKEIERATKQQQLERSVHGRLRVKGGLVNAPEDEKVVEALKSNLEVKAESNAKISLKLGEARELQERIQVTDYVDVNGREAGRTFTFGGGALTHGLDYRTEAWSQALEGQKAYQTHQRKVTTQAFRPGVQSLLFDIPRDGRLYVFSKLNEEAKVTVRQFRAGTLHGLKTVLGLVVLALVVWAIEKLRIRDRVRKLSEGRQLLAALVGLTALLALVILLGRLRYGLLNTLFVLAVIAWGIYWIARTRVQARNAAAVARAAAKADAQTEEEK